MNKKIIAFFCIAIIMVSVFSACGKKGLTLVGSDGRTHLLVTDAEGNTVLNGQGELAVYVTDGSGDYVTYESGEKQTNYVTFPDKLVAEDKAKIETPIFIFELPEDWKADADQNFIYKDNENIMFEQPLVSSLTGRSVEEAVETQVQFVNQLAEMDAYKDKISCKVEEQTIKSGEKELDCIVVVMKNYDDNKEVNSMQRLYYIELEETEMLIQISFVCKDKDAIGTIDDVGLLNSGFIVK
ncbi:MAG: hypothetical protein J1F24_01900 [Oscillospiraceae bacterium]|nr:hypothetical protein [Oscillospiraceae bacterium]